MGHETLFTSTLEKVGKIFGPASANSPTSASGEVPPFVSRIAKPTYRVDQEKVASPFRTNHLGDMRGSGFSKSSSSWGYSSCALFSSARRLLPSPPAKLGSTRSANS